MCDYLTKHTMCVADACRTPTHTLRKKAIVVKLRFGSRVEGRSAEWRSHVWEKEATDPQVDSVVKLQRTLDTGGQILASDNGS